jgi:uncharacterized protein YkwD
VSSERIVGALAGSAVSATLGALVLASFVLPVSASRIASHDAPAAAPLVAHDERAAPVARGFSRVRDDSPVEIASLAAPGGSTTVAVAVEPAPVVAPAVAPVVPPAPPTAVAGAAPAAVTVDVTASTLAAEARMLTLMNISRAQAGFVPLVTDASVMAAARAHSAVEAQYRYVYHDGPDGTARSRDATACGTGWYGENTGKVWQENVDRLHIEFMSEPPEPINHRTNVMDPLFRRVGVGAVQGTDALYMTMVFCR